MPSALDPSDLALARALAHSFPTTGAATAELAACRARLGLPMGVVHVVSDVHGEYKKLRHVINNASGRLRPLVESLFADALDDAGRSSLLNTLYYPHEQMQHLAPDLADPRRRQAWVRATLRQQFAVVRALARHYRLGHVEQFFPPELRELFSELLSEPCARDGHGYVDAMLDALAAEDADLPAVRAASHVVRALGASELIVAGDLGDRGPRIDRVIDYLMRQPNVSILWGNHDAEWMGACLGQPALIASVLRFSARYRRFSQLEEGYGIPLEPLEKLARDVYGDDPCTAFKLFGTGLRDELLMRRMQKAAAILEFKFQGQTSRRHPDWELEDRNLLHKIDHLAGTVDIDGKIYPLTDRHLPTVDPADPYRLSVDEQACFDRIRQSFVTSQRLWEHMSWVVRRGAMWARRDPLLIFHACVPVDAGGEPLPLVIDGQPRVGREQMDAVETVIRRAFRKGADAAGDDADFLWYLWVGARSPLFGKDKMATFEGVFVDDKAAREEHKNAYFKLIHDAAFVKRIGRLFGAGDDVLLVNGHVPVKIEAGESPVKKGGNAVTIDGAFSEAYGDHGYTLIFDPARVALAQHAHFDSVQKVIESNVDMVPSTTVLRSFEPPLRVADSTDGEALRSRIAGLEKLTAAYRDGVLLEGAEHNA